MSKADASDPVYGVAEDSALYAGVRPLRPAEEAPAAAAATAASAEGGSEARVEDEKAAV